MIKEIKFILQRKIITGGFDIKVVEMVDNPTGFPFEKPVSGAVITVSQEGKETPVYTYTTIEDGRFIAENLPVGTYVLKVDCSGFINQVKAETVV